MYTVTLRQSSLSMLPASLPMPDTAARREPGDEGVAVGSICGAMIACFGTSRMPAHGAAGFGGMKRPAPAVDAP